MRYSASQTRTARHTEDSPARVASSADAVSMAPPESGIDFVDRVDHLAEPAAIQAKLTVGAPDDRFEREADRVADQVMRMSDSAVADPATSRSGGKEGIQRVCEECEEELQRQPLEEEEVLQARELSGRIPRLTPDLEVRIRDHRGGGGAGLGAGTRAFMEPRFGRDFSQVRVHAASEAQALSSALGAKAFTVGNDVFFRRGQYQPRSMEGRRLLAHELTHTVQQTAGVQRQPVDESGRTPRTTPEPETRIPGGGAMPGTGEWTDLTHVVQQGGDQSSRVRGQAPERRNQRSARENPKGDRYNPDWESDYYSTLRGPELDSVNKRTDARFKAETGVTRALDPGDKADKPLVRRWLRLRDKIINEDILKGDPIERNKAAFSEKLKEAATKMEIIDPRIGSALELGLKPPKGWALELDEELERKYEGMKRGKLVYKGKDPAGAVDELFKKENLEGWGLDCAEFVQLTHLYARRHTLKKDGFNKAIEASGGVLEVRMENSTGYESIVEYHRLKPSDRMKEVGSGRSVNTPVEELLEDAPVGSKVVWRNLRGTGANEFENAIKVGRNLYGAHGFKRTEKKIFSRVDLEREMAKSVTDGDLDEFRKANVFVSRIKYVEVP